MFRAIIAGSLLTFSAMPALADQSCRMDVDIEVIKPSGAKERRDPARADFKYGEQFDVRMVGTYPGTFCVQTINPANETTVWKPIAVDGSSEVRLPCGAPGICPTQDDSVHFELTDDDTLRPSGSQEAVIMLIRYYPCTPKNGLVKGNVQKINHQLPVCGTTPVACPMREQRLASFESITLSSSKTSGCEPDIENGRVMLHEKILFKARRN